MRAHAELAPEKHEAAEEDEPDVRESEAGEHEDDGERDIEAEAGVEGAQGRRGSGRGVAKDRGAWASRRQGRRLTAPMKN